jgi:uncharacterized protein (TIGR02145 family)
MKIVSTIFLVCFLMIIGATQKSQAQCSPGYSQIIVNIIPDSYPAETSWDIKDASNTVIASGTTNNDTLCYLTGNLLHFTIYDSYGDGICCGWGNGSYNVFIDGNLIASGGEFTFYETTFFNYPPGYVSTTLINTYQQLLNHCNNTTLLTPAQINSLADTIQLYHFYLADTLPVISAAFDVINCYETNPGPVFLNAHTTGGFPNAPGALDGFEYDRAIYTIQQDLFEVLYTQNKIVQYSTFLQGRKYLTSNYFPGVCPLPVDSSQKYIATVNASMPTDWGKPTAWSKTPVRRPTGYYLSPGSIGKVKVPDIMVNAGYKILVGAHPLMNSSINPILRFFRVFNTYEITDSVTIIGNPFGGGIYIINPYQASAGLQQIELTNVVPAPFFSAKSYDATTLSQWQNVQRHNPAPWADFESEKFMMQVPTSFIYNYSDPVTLMADWDARMDVVSNLLGYPLVRNNQVLYVMLDVHILYPGYLGIGNPQINNSYSPYDVQNGNSQMWFLVPGAAHMWDSEFHELGHSQLMEKFPGEAEAIVNLISAAIYNELYGIDLDTAFGMSFDNQYWINRDQAAINWMVTHNFRIGNPMDISNTTKDEVRYQFRGYGKYIEIAALFGWGALESYYHQVNLDYINGVPPGPLGQIDDRILKLSKAAGVDLRPLIHFWGVHPQDSAALAQAISSNNLQPSPLICNRLLHYQSIIPMDSAQFDQHARAFFNGPVPPGGDPDYGNGWYNVWLPLYNNSHGDSAVAALQKIIDTYFPNGCECAGLNLPQVTNTQLSKSICSGETTNIALSSNVPGTMFHWSASLTSGNITGFSADSGLVINQVLVNQIASPGIVSYHVIPIIGNCSGTPVDFTVTISPGPVVTFNSCFDTLTTLNAKPIKLNGGIPLGGTYSGPGVNPATGVFTPLTAGLGTKNITFSYTNVALCSARKTRTILVQSTPAFTCGNNMTDIRDNKVYPTVQIGSQCWFASDLNYGAMISSTQNQRDNCLPERYLNSTSFYQWDELMLYDDTQGLQGLCPPGWHVPTEGDWNILFANWAGNGFAGAPLKYSGYSRFNALLTGANHINVQWDFQNFAVFFWSSTAHGPYKAWAHGMNDYDPSVSLYPSLRSNAFSVRCLKD